MAQMNPKGGGPSNIASADSNDMFLKLTLEKLLHEKDMKKSRYQSLKLACETALRT
jgi:hypothetical protein